MSKRKKHVYSSTDNLCHEFIHQEDTRDLRCSASSISSENGDTIYSYSRIIGKKLTHACGKKPVILTLFSYPSPTTSKHLRSLWSAIDRNKYTECRLFFDNSIYRVNTVEELPIYVIHQNVVKWIEEFRDAILKRESIVTGPRIKGWEAKASINRVLAMLKALSVKYAEYKAWCEERKKELDLIEVKSAISDIEDEKTLSILFPLLVQVEQLIIGDQNIDFFRYDYDVQYYAFCYSLVELYPWITPEKVEELEQRHQSYLDKKREEKDNFYKNYRKNELKKTLKQHWLAEKFVEKAEEWFMKWANTTKKEFELPIDGLSRTKLVQGRLITTLGINIQVNDEIKDQLRTLWVVIRRVILSDTKFVKFENPILLVQYPVYSFGINETRYGKVEKVVPTLTVGCHNIPYVDLYLIAKILEFNLSDLPVPMFNFSEYIDPEELTKHLTEPTSYLLKGYSTELITECEEELKMRANNTI